MAAPDSLPVALQVFAPEGTMRKRLKFGDNEDASTYKKRRKHRGAFYIEAGT